ncbi:MAG: bifunctional folylpolyglutamate synthase/dihydrofolate synthase [Saprospiraceae bacterium]
MTYRETLDYLFAQLPMYHRIGPAAFKKDLTNTIALCGHLGNPHLQFPTLHVAGTNGKGSVSHFLAAMLQAAGLKVGLYISPHYKDFRERIKVNGRYISQREVVDFVALNRPALEAIQPSFFEMCVGMAFDHFARKRVDVAVVEVGLGGRLDSTNVLPPPLVSVITNISFDHMAMLGDTLPKIAFEKAGIIKPGSPVVVGEEQPETMPVFRAVAAECMTPVHSAQANFSVVEKAQTNWQSTTYDVFRKNGEPYLTDLELEASGPYQAKNLATALQAIEILNAWGFTPEDLRRRRPPSGKGQQPPLVGEAAIREGLRHLRGLTRFMGRWQVIGENPTVLCDSAHNEAGLREAFAKINALTFNRLHVVTGFVNDKDVRGVLPLFPTNARYFFAKADIPRGLDAPILRDMATEFGLHGRAYSSVKNALRAARRAAAPGDLVVVIGSIFVVGEVL